MPKTEYHYFTLRKLCYEILMQHWGQRTFSNRQLAIRFYMKIVMVMMLGNYVHQTSGY